MIDLEMIEREINKLEHTRDTTYALCQRLSWLYIVRDHLLPSEGSPEVARLSGSEFLEACSGVPYPSLMAVLDEHMSALSVVQPREYNALMGRIRALR